MVVLIASVPDRREEVVERLHQAPPEPEQGPAPSRWTLTLIQHTFDWLADYSLSGVWYWLTGCGIDLRTGRIRQFSPDPEYAGKEAYLRACLSQVAPNPDRIVLLFMDEMGFFRWPTPSLNWMTAAPTLRQAVPCADNNRQWRTVGILNAWNGQVNYLDNYIVGRRVLAQMYHLIDQTYPDAQHIYLVQDNWSVHRHPDVMAVCDQLPRIEPVWLPTYAHWLNPIEKLWRWLRQDILHLHQYAADWDTLLYRVHAFLDQFANGSPELLHYVGLSGEGKLAQALRNI